MQALMKDCAEATGAGVEEAECEKHQLSFVEECEIRNSIFDLGKLRFVLLSDMAQAPSRGTEYSAGLDLFW
jgi:hypothetical protein